MFLNRLIKWLSGIKIEKQNLEEYFLQDKKENINLNYIIERSEDFIIQFEGRYLTKDKKFHTAYLDPIYIWTIGYGHVFLTEDKKMHTSSKSLRKNTKIVDKIEDLPKEWQKITEQKARYLLRQNVIEIYYSIEQKVIKKLNENQICALISFIYNLGMSNFKRSTLRRLILNNIFDKQLITSSFVKFSFADKKFFRGLERRRRQEANLFFE